MAMKISDYGKGPNEMSHEEMENKKKKKKKRYTNEVYQRRLKQNSGRNGSY